MSATKTVQGGELDLRGQPAPYCPKTHLGSDAFGLIRCSQLNGRCTKQFFHYIAFDNM